MNKYYYDLHLHSCLSPCGDDDNTPNNLAGFATLCGLNIVALTDHNTTKNCPAFFEAAKKHGLIPVAGMELTTSEDIHVVCLFETLEGAMEFDKEIDSKRIKILNKEHIFGCQLICDGEDNIIGKDEYLLPNGTTVSIEDAPEIVSSFGGICYPAHIDRQANGLINILGTFPKQIGFSCFELHEIQKQQEYVKKYGLESLIPIISSDAHYLTDMRDKEAFFELDDEPYSSALVRKKLFEKLR